MTVGWGVLGSGAIARHLGWVIDTSPGATVVSVGSRSGVPYDAVIADPAVEVVYVALPHHLHVRWTLAALAAGKHVLCEKPLGLRAAEVALVRAAAGASMLVEASFWRWHPRVALATTLLPRLGAVEHVEAGFTIAGTSGWRLEPPSGGALLDLGCYPVSAALWAAGDVTSVAARSRSAGGVDLATEVLCEHRSGATSSLRAAFDADTGQWLVVTGAAGELQLPGDAFTGGGEVWLSDGAGTERIDVGSRPRGESGYAEMVAAVTAAVRGEPAWLLPLEESAAVAAVLDAARKSAAAGTPVGLP